MTTHSTRGDGRWPRMAVAVCVLVLAVGAAAGSALLVIGGASPGRAAAAGGGGGRDRGGATAASGPTTCTAGSPRVTVTGVGTVRTTPNLLTLSVDVHTTAASAGAALASNDTDTAAVVTALTRAGTRRADIQTTNLSVQPDYASTGSTVTGYSVDNTIVAKIRTLSSAGTLIDAAVAAGGNAARIDSLAFSLTQPIHAQDRARRIAVHQAIDHAAAMAAAAGRRLGGICSLADQTTTSTPVPLPFGFGVAGQAASPRTPVPVEAGSQRVTARVTIVYSLA